MLYQYLSFLYWFEQSAVAMFIFSKLESTGESDKSALCQVCISTLQWRSVKKEQPYAGSVRYLTKSSKEDRGAALKIICHHLYPYIISHISDKSLSISQHIILTDTLVCPGREYFR